MTKVLLLNPPLSESYNINYAIAILMGQLKGNNIDTTVVDLNIEFLYDILTTEYLSETKRTLEKIFNQEYNKNDYSPYKLSIKEFEMQKNIIHRFLYEKEKVTNAVINGASSILPMLKKYKNNPTLGKKYSILLQWALDFASLPFYPSRIIDNVERNPLYKLNYDDLMNRCSNKERNIFVNYFIKKIQEINANQYDIIGISVLHDINLSAALTLSKILKMYTKAKVVIGGCLINLTLDSFLNHPDMFGTYFDELLIGEGEDSILQYVEYVKGELSKYDVNGMVFKENGVIHKNKIEKIKDIEQIKAPSFDGVDFNKYLYPKIDVEFSKGCYWRKCLFCCETKYKNFYIRNPINAVNVIEELVLKYNINKSNIVDDAISINFASQFADELIKRNLTIEFGAYIRFEPTLTYEVLQKLYKAGCKLLYFSIESASNHIQQVMNKGISTKAAEEILRNAHDIGIDTVVGFIFGFPTETEQDLLETVDFYKRNKKYINNPQTFKFTMLKTSIIAESKNSLGLSNIREKEEFSPELIYDSISAIEKDKFYKILEENDIKIISTVII